MHPLRRQEQFAAKIQALRRIAPARPLATLLLLCGITLAAHSQTKLPATPVPVPTPSAQQPGDPVPDSGVPALGVTPDQDDDGLLSLRGLPANQTTITLDGIETTQRLSSAPAGSGSDPAPDPDGDPDSAVQTTGPAAGLARGRRAGAVSTFSRAAVRELRPPSTTSTDAYSAQAAHIGGGTLQRETLSGGDALHGTLIYALRSSALAAANPLAIATSYADGVITQVVAKPHDLRQTLDLVLGGPVPGIRRLAFLYSFQGDDRDFPAISSPTDPNFYSLTATQVALLRNRGLSLAAIDAGLDYVSSLTGLTPRTAANTVHFLRLDAALSRRAALSADYNRVRWNRPAGLSDAPVIARGRASLGNSSGALDRVQLELTLQPIRRLAEELTARFTRDLQFESPQSSLPQEPAVGPNLGAGALAPQVLIGPNGLLFGTPASVTQAALPDERSLTLADTVTLTLGAHQLSAGGTASFTQDLTATLQNAEGSFTYDSGTTAGHAGGLVDFLTDYTFSVNAYPNGACPAITAVNHLFCFRSYSQSFGEQTVSFPTSDFSAFIQDRWRVSRSLTLLAGLRYEYTLLPLPQTPNAALDAIFGVRGATSIFPEDRNNLGPRLAAAWEPFGAGRGTLHAGVGVFYGRLPGATIRSALSDTAQASGTTRIRITPATSVACPQAMGQGFGYPCSFLHPPTGIVAQTTSAMVFDRRFRLPAIGQGSLSLERAFHGTSVFVGYSFSLARQLPSSTDLNIAPSTQSASFQLQGGTGAAGVRDGETFRLPLYTGRISPSFGPVTDISSSANASYHALLLSATGRVTASLQFRGVYSWSKALDFAPNLSATPRTSGQFDPFTNGYDKAISALNLPQVASALVRWAPRADVPQRWLHQVARGWTLTPAVIARSGRPYSLDLAGGNRLPGGHESLNGSGGALYLPTVGRNTLRLPPTVRVDLAGARAFRLNGRIHGEASAEAFNLFNHRQISSVVQRAYLIGTPVAGITPLVFQSAANIAAEGLNSLPFGTANGSGTSLSRERQIEFRVRLEF